MTGKPAWRPEQSSAYNGREEDILMPLRDHFRSPLDDQRHWEGFHGQWPAMLVLDLARRLPRRYFAEPRVHPRASAEIDVATFHEEDLLPPGNGEGAEG